MDHDLPARSAPTAVLELAVAVPTWQSEARCADADPSVFFPDKGETAADAKAICASCPVIAECAEYALEIEAEQARSTHGVWGGLTPTERRQLRRKRSAA